MWRNGSTSITILKVYLKLDKTIKINLKGMNLVENLKYLEIVQVLLILEEKQLINSLYFKYITKIDNQKDC